MKKEVIVIFLVISVILTPFSSAQLNNIEIKDVNVNENAIQVLVQNNVDKDFNQEVFIINNQQQVIREEILSNFTAKFFYINYPSGIKLETIKISIAENEDEYDFTGQEDKFVLNQAVSQTSEVTLVESNSPVSYIYSAGRVAKIQDNQIVYFSSDNIGSTSIETDSAGSISFKANYLPFGKELSFSSINKEKYGFTSKEYDPESSLNYFNARYYNPSNGKFISNDPIFKPSEGGYQYVRNNPLRLTDPSGKQIPYNPEFTARLSFKIVGYAKENPLRLPPKQCIRGCQLFSSKAPEEEKTIYDKNGLVYNGLQVIKYITLPIRATFTNTPDEKLKSILKDFEDASDLYSQITGRKKEELVENMNGLEFVSGEGLFGLGGNVIGAPASRGIYPERVVYYDQNVFTKLKESIDRESYLIFLGWTIGHEAGHLEDSKTPWGNVWNNLPWSEKDVFNEWDLKFYSGLSSEQAEKFNTAKEKWEKIIDQR